MEIFFAILAGVPVWIWPLLLVLVLLGLHSSRDHPVLIPTYLAMPLIAISNLPTLQAQPNLELALAVWGVTYLCGALLGHRLQTRWMITRRGLKAWVRGEWFSMAMMMLLFWVNFANALVDAVAPEISASLAFGLILATLLGLASGSFLGRALRILFWQPQPADAMSQRLGET